MHGARLHILILTIVGLLAAITMVFLNLYGSWSQYARSLEEPLLFAALTSFSTIFIIRSFTHVHKTRVLAKIGKMYFRIEHCNRIAGYMFIGVLMTPVTHPSQIIETAHFIFTGFAILFAYWELVTYHESGTAKNTLMAVLALWGILGFLLGFVFKLYSTGLGELLAAIPISIHILTTNIKKDGRTIGKTVRGI